MNCVYKKPKNRATLSQLVVKGRKIYVVIDWTDFDDEREEILFHIRLFDQDLCWKGIFSRTFAKQFGNECCEPPDVYYSRMKETLTPVDQGLFKYDLKYKGVDSAVFSWKRSFEGGGVFLVHGLIPLKRDPKTNKDELLQFLVDENTKLRATASKLAQRNNEINEELTKYKQELDQFINSKHEMESILYGKFISLLNAKKARIKLLEEHIHKFYSETIKD